MRTYRMACLRLERMGWVLGVSVCGAVSVAACSNGPRTAGVCSASLAQGQCIDLPPVAQIHFQVTPPQSDTDYPYGAQNPPPDLPEPGATVYLSAAGSLDPEGTAVSTFWNVQDSNAEYLDLAPNASAERVSFSPPRIGTYSVTLEVTEVDGLRQTGQTMLSIDVEPRPCAHDGVSAPCSDALDIPAGTFLMGSVDSVGFESEHPQHAATLSAFALDKYEVTVGRFRRYLSNYDPLAPAAGAGAHPRIPGTGWLPEWAQNMPGSSADFMFAISECGGAWTNQPGANEARPVSCVSWYEAFAFCVSEGKRLPTEAEWEYAAAGGDEQRTYPWGDAAPSIDLAVYGCLFDGQPSCADADLPVVGSVPNGVGRFGQLDLAGSVWEWTMDSYAPYTTAACDDCENATDPTLRAFRGGDFKYDDPSVLRAASRYAFDPAFPDQTRGLRCARSGADVGQ